MRRFTRPLLILLALVFLFEAWLWEHLSPVVAWVVARLPLKRFKEWLADNIRGLSPAWTLIVFIVPFILLIPLKFLEVFLIAKRQWLAAIAVLVFAKLLGLGVTAFIFDLTRPKLLQMAWFHRVYEVVLGWLAWAHALVDPIKQQIKRRMQIFAPHRAGRAVKLFWRIRRRMRTRMAA
ncbi:MAG TPA: hypothetical protein VMH84_08680 [Xanthobacteraceae bacterium]|nr:hypothetical protein [Xanthobacteraceae bacterium]